MLRRKVRCPNCSARVKLTRQRGAIPAHWVQARCEAYGSTPAEFRRLLASGRLGPRRPVRGRR